MRYDGMPSTEVLVFLTTPPGRPVTLLNSVPYRVSKTLPNKEARVCASRVLCPLTLSAVPIPSGIRVGAGDGRSGLRDQTKKGQVEGPRLCPLGHGEPGGGGYRGRRGFEQRDSRGQETGLEQCPHEEAW
ncbi:hypothetical protein D623_10029557 [Myotis brandtii]|uniref:Uncharacterized protein n=1 Tax=Myotis brandtii TaxID=109478 RepID=S7N7T7_MYOBR|nr:hypothetical protein D623_10029557 [Myotis brandtii]